MASINTQPNSATEIAFEFVRSLATELSAGRVDLPSFPEVAIRVRRVLADENSNLEKVVRVVGSEPALAARLLRIANSASLNTLGRQITDLRTAINRMGYNMVRSASMSFAMAQIRNNNKLAGVRPYLDEVWERSTLVAAVAFVLARKCTRLNADEAMLTGMMHGIGKLYVLTRVAGHPELFDSATTVNQIIDEWHAQIGRAILENWEFAEEMAAAVGNQTDLDREGSEAADLGDVIAAANLMASFATDPEGLQVASAGRASIMRLGLDHEKMTAIMQDTAVEVAALRSALGG